MQEIIVTWPEYNQKIEQLAYKVYQSNWEFNQILCIARGGLRVGDVFSRLFNKPLAILSVASYSGTDGTVRGKLTFSRNISMTTETLSSKLLLVDDLVDSGVTMTQTCSWLKVHKEHEVDEIKTAAIWYKACSILEPDFYIDYLPDNPWVRQPFSIYEGLTPTDLHKSSWHS